MRGSWGLRGGWGGARQGLEEISTKRLAQRPEHRLEEWEPKGKLCGWSAQKAWRPEGKACRRSLQVTDARRRHPVGSRGRGSGEDCPSRGPLGLDPNSLVEQKCL